MADKKHRKPPAKRRAKSKPDAAPATFGPRSVAIGVAAGLGAIAAIMIGLLGVTRRSAAGNAEHPAPDLAAGAPIGVGRAPEAFRPDPTAPVPESEREGLRPATGPAPSLSAMRGEMANQTGASNG